MIMSMRVRANAGLRGSEQSSSTRICGAGSEQTKACTFREMGKESVSFECYDLKAMSGANAFPCYDLSVFRCPHAAATAAAAAWMFGVFRHRFKIAEEHVAHAHLHVFLAVCMAHTMFTRMHARTHTAAAQVYHSIPTDPRH